MTEPRTCPHCGKPVAESGLGGLCPECLMKAGLGTQTEAATEPGAAPPKPPVTAPPPVEAIAGHFPQLEILECLGRGGMGVVYRARQPRLNRMVALKILAPEKGVDPRFAARFQREAEALARMNHPNIVAVHDFGEVNGLCFLVMEFVDGANLRQLMRSGRLAPEQALQIVPRICEALQFAHEQGVVHRDIKPENVLLDRDGRVKIADFGIAKMVGGTAEGEGYTQDSQVLGTPHYMAPEQVEQPQRVDHRADIYSLGVVFYEMLTGELPLGRFAPPSRTPGVDVRLDDVVLKTLEKEPERRYQHASQVRSEVETIATSRPAVVPPAADAPHTAVTAARFSRSAIAGAAWAPFFFIAGFLTFFLVQPVVVAEGQPPPGPWWWQTLLRLTLLPLGLTAPFGTTILGWIAVGQIRRSAGRLQGLGLAVADGLLFPLLALDGLIVAVFFNLLLGMGIPLAIASLPALVLVLVADFSIASAVWRAVNRPPDAAAKTTRTQPFVILGLSVAAHLLGALLVIMFLSIMVPRFVATYADFGVTLPATTRLTIGLSNFIQYRWFMVLPALLLADLAMCLLIRAAGSRVILHVWTALVMMAQVALVAFSAWTLNLPMGALRENLTAEPQPVELKEPPFIVRLPQGHVELVGVSRHPSAGQSWWTPDGRQEFESTFRSQGSRSTILDDTQGREFVIRVAGLPPDSSGPMWKLDPAAGWAGGAVLDPDGSSLPDFHMISATLPASAETVNLGIGIASGPWETVAGQSARGSGMSSFSHEKHNWIVSFTQASQEEDGVQLAVTHTVKDWEIRLVAATTDGREILSGRSESNGTDAFGQLTARFAHLRLTEVREFRFQVRPYGWVEFRNVSLQPGSPKKLLVVQATGGGPEASRNSGH